MLLVVQNSQTWSLGKISLVGWPYKKFNFTSCALIKLSQVSNMLIIYLAWKKAIYNIQMNYLNARSNLDSSQNIGKINSFFDYVIFSAKTGIYGPVQDWLNQEGKKTFPIKNVLKEQRGFPPVAQKKCRFLMLIFAYRGRPFFSLSMALQVAKTGTIEAKHSVQW